ncbi:MAG: hypothetical protein V7605_1255, partial [Acidimicrobiaceae bacterium]
DIGPCLGDGLIVTGSGITVDLAGHTIKGAAFDPASTIDQAGIHLDNVSGVTVKGGTVRGFFAGVLVKGGSGNTITDMKIVDNVGLGTTLYNDGIVLDGATTTNVANNTVTGNGPDAGIAMINDASNNRIAKNSVTDNHVPWEGIGPGGATQAADSGISADSGARDNLVTDNQVLRNGLMGVNFGGFRSSHNKAIHNTIANNGAVGVNAGANGHLISDNIIQHNGYDQFLPPGGAPLFGGRGGVASCGETRFPPCGPDFTTIQDNTITQNAGPGVNLGFLGFQFAGGCGAFGCFPPEDYKAPRSNLVQRNIVRNNTGDGIFVDCDRLYDADFNSTCLKESPPHRGQRILNNFTSGNGGADAGISAWDLHDANPRCDHDIWSGNTYDTAKPFCTTK